VAVLSLPTQTAAIGTVGVAIGFVVFVALGVAGVLLVRDHPLGVPLSLAAQAVQVPKLFTDAFSYEFYGPITVGLELRPSNWSLAFTFNLGGAFTVALGREVTVVGVGVNLAALIVLVLLLRHPAIRQLPTTGGLVTR